MAMLHRRQAPGRDTHKHFSLAPARSHTKPPTNPQSAPAPSLLQAEPNKKETPVRSPALLASVFSRLAVFVCAKNLIRPKEQKKFQPNRSEGNGRKGKKKFQPNRSEGKKVTAISKWVLKIASAKSADMDQTAAKIA